MPPEIQDKNVQNLPLIPQPKNNNIKFLILGLLIGLIPLIASLMVFFVFLKRSNTTVITGNNENNNNNLPQIEKQIQIEPTLIPTPKEPSFYYIRGVQPISKKSDGTSVIDSYVEKKVYSTTLNGTTTELADLIKIANSYGEKWDYQNQKSVIVSTDASKIFILLKSKIVMYNIIDKRTSVIYDANTNEIKEFKLSILGNKLVSIESNSGFNDNGPNPERYELISVIDTNSLKTEYKTIIPKKEIYFILGGYDELKSQVILFEASQSITGVDIFDLKANKITNSGYSFFKSMILFTSLSPDLKKLYFIKDNKVSYIEMNQFTESEITDLKGKIDLNNRSTAYLKSINDSTLYFNTDLNRDNFNYVLYKLNPVSGEVDKMGFINKEVSIDINISCQNVNSNLLLGVENSIKNNINKLYSIDPVNKNSGVVFSETRSTNSYITYDSLCIR